MHYADMFQIRRFNLLVIDECHYATGNHAYAVIMNKFYHSTPKEECPHVVGLTASPLVNVKENHSDEQLATMLSNLERTLDATLAPTSGLVSDFGSGLLIKSAEERVVDYRGTNVGRDIPSADNLDLHESRYREMRQLNQLYKDLGPLVLSLYCKTLVRELSRNEFENETSQQFNRAVKHLIHIATFCEQEYCTASNNVSAF
jgi:superfamily II DNA or RNA helicase